MLHFIYIIAILVLILLVYFFYSKSKNKERERIELEHIIVQHEIKNVFKIILVEAFQTDIQTYSDSKKLLIGSSEKKAAVIVKATVSVGFDMEEWQKPIIDKENRKMIFETIPEPKIISIDHDVEWYDIDPGWFNKFTSDDFTNIGRRGKEQIREMANKGGLLIAAKKRILTMLKEIEEKTKWQINIKFIPLVNEENSQNA